MQKLVRNKAYKGRNPEETVALIKNILQENNISTKIQNYYNKQADVYSCNLYVDNDGMGNIGIGSNGKGMSKNYSLASGYAEFMERAQNGIMFGENSESYFDVFPKEIEDCKDDVSAFFKDNFGSNECVSQFVISNYSKCNMMPFTSYDGNEKILVPSDFLLRLCTSNGMCAGNNRKEAIIQGTSEIFERYAQRKIMMDRLCPPVVPNEYFYDTEIYEKLNKISKHSIRFEIRDCSLGMGLPVIGIYMQMKNGKELFHLGADPSPVTALERCITEIFQGISTIDEAEFHENCEDSRDEFFWKYQMQLCSWGGNIYPKELGNGTKSWEFKGFEHPVSQSDEDDLNWYLQIIERLGKKLYIRDADVMGFPSYWCYIPMLSCVDMCFDDGQELRNFLKYEILLKDARSLANLSKKELKVFAENYKEYLNKFWYYELDNYRNRFYPKGYEIDENEDFYLFSAKLFAAAGMKSDAADAMENYIFSGNMPKDDEDYYNDFVMLMRWGQCQIKSTKDMIKIFPQNYPVCPDCDKCHVKAKCHKQQIDSIQSAIMRK